MRFLTRPALLACMATLTLAACDPAEFDKDPDVRRDARAGRTCVNAVKEQTGSTAVLNTTLPVVELNQYIIDAPDVSERWLCQTDDEGNASKLVKMGVG